MHDGGTSASLAPASGAITPAALTIAAASDTKIYDATSVSARVPAISGLQGADSVTPLSQRFNAPDVGAR
jgi:hypothetical protein